MDSKKKKKNSRILEVWTELREKLIKALALTQTYRQTIISQSSPERQQRIKELQKEIDAIDEKIKQKEKEESKCYKVEEIPNQSTSSNNSLKKGTRWVPVDESKIEAIKKVIQELENRRRPYLEKLTQELTEQDILLNQNQLKNGYEAQLTIMTNKWNNSQIKLNRVRDLVANGEIEKLKSLVKRGEI